MSTADNDEHDSPIEAYLDELVAGMPGRQPRALRHLLAETEAHLRDDAAHRTTADGLSSFDAELAAVRHFGPVGPMVDAERRRSEVPLVAVARQVTVTALLLGAIGAIAVGISGVLAGIFKLVAGSRALIDVQPGHLLSASDCARWMALDPHAPTCRDAAISDWVGEVVGYRLGAGVLGLLALAAFLLLRRRGQLRNTWSLLPPVVSDAVATTLFSVAAIYLVAMSIDTVVVSHGTGYGQWLTATPVALAAAAIFAIRLVRDIRHQPA